MSSFDDRAVNSLALDSMALWKGCILASCVHGVMLAEYPFTLSENAWFGEIYMAKNDEGSKAALVFSEERELLMGMFDDRKSPRSRLVLSSWYARSHYKEAPEDIQDAAQALSMLFEERAGEKQLPFVTTGFWEEDGQILSRDNYEDWLEHGGHILSAQMMPFEKAMSYYKVKCSMDAARVEIAARIYRERIKSPKERVVLKREEIQVLEETGPYNIQTCREVFGQFGVVFEDEARI